MGRNRKKRKNKKPHPIIVFTDGSADSKEGAAGFGYMVIDCDNKVVEEGSGVLDIPNNAYAELKAVISGIEAAAQYEPTKITVYTDYKTIPLALRNEISRWHKNGWRTTKGKPVKHADVWEHLEELAKKHNADVRWVRGHSGNEYNGRCDFLAWEAMRNASRKRKTKLPVS